MGRYQTPLAFKTALEHRLREEADRSRMRLERLRQLVVFDRFITRVFVVFGKACVLKGGVVVEFRLGGARTTKDVDVRLTGRPDAVLGKLQEAGRLDLDDFLAFEVVPDPRHPEITAEGMVYDGLRFRVENKLAGKIYGSRFGVDVAFADVLEGDVELIPGSSFLSFAGIEPATFRVYPLETHIAEKLHAYTLPRERENSRVKDLPDIALLASTRVIEGTTLRAAMERTFNHRNTHPLPTSLPAPPSSWTPRYAALADEDNLPWKSMEDLLTAVRAFSDPVLHAQQGRWQPEQWRWTDNSD